MGNCKIFGRPSFEGGQQYTLISTIKMYRYIKIRHNILINTLSLELYGDDKIQLYA